MNELPTPESVRKEQEALDQAMDNIRNSPYQREKDTMRFLQEFEELNDEQLNAKRKELMGLAEQNNEELSIMTRTGRQIDAIDQILSRRRKSR